jgi:2,3-bisphosphoglycerate-dependent phosphoglycerate mutase
LQFNHPILGENNTMQFYYIRHGQSANNLLYATTGSDKGRDCDPKLTETGQQQAELLADYLYREKFDLTHLYTSMMVRAVSTGTIVADRLGLPLVAWPDLHEEGGIFLADEQGNLVGQSGKDRAYFKRHFPGLVLPEKMGASGWWNRPFESVADRPVRARRFVQDLTSRHAGTDHRVAVISHGGFYNHVLSALLNLSTNHSLWFLLNNTAISRIDFSSGRKDFIYHNRVDFLPPELIT